MVLSAGGAVGFTGVFIAQAGEFVASADAIAVAGFGSGLDRDERHNKGNSTFSAALAQEPEFRRWKSLLQVLQMSQAERGAQVLAKVQPVLFRNGHKDVDDLRVELAAGATLDLFAGVRHWQGSAIGAVADHGVERIGDGKDPGTERNLFALQSARIAGTVEKLLMCKNDFCRVTQERNADQHVVADFAMFTHFPFFSVVQRTGFAQDTVWDSHLTDIVEKSGTRQDGQIGVRHGHGSGDRYAERRNALAVAFCFGVL